MTGNELETAIARAAALIRAADGLVIAAGAGMGVDSGLPDFRGPQGFWLAYPALGRRGIQFERIANPHAFAADPDLAWGFYGHRLNLYRATRPHSGFVLLLSLAASLPHGAFVFTSNVDGQCVSRPLVIELGAGTSVPAVRHCSERYVQSIVARQSSTTRRRRRSDEVPNGSTQQAIVECQRGARAGARQSPVVVCSRAQGSAKETPRLHCGAYDEREVAAAPRADRGCCQACAAAGAAIHRHGSR